MFFSSKWSRPRGQMKRVLKRDLSAFWCWVLVVHALAATGDVLPRLLVLLMETRLDTFVEFRYGIGWFFTAPLRLDLVRYWPEGCRRPTEKTLKRLVETVVVYWPAYACWLI